MRIIAASSKPGDCVLDPFVGSGTTTVAAKKLQRNYVGIEISADYAKKARQRLIQLGLKTNVPLDPAELNELKRLIPDMGCSPKQVLLDKDLLELFTNQFSIRMNGRKKYSATDIVTALKGLT